MVVSLFHFTHSDRKEKTKTEAKQTLAYCLRSPSGPICKNLIRTFQFCLLHTSFHPISPPLLPNSGHLDLLSSWTSLLVLTSGPLGFLLFSQFGAVFPEPFAWLPPSCYKDSAQMSLLHPFYIVPLITFCHVAILFSSFIIFIYLLIYFLIPHRKRWISFILLPVSSLGPRAMPGTYTINICQMSNSPPSPSDQIL